VTQEDKLYRNGFLCDCMTDEEYREWLTALARKHIQLGKLSRQSLEATFKRLSSAARVVNVARDSTDRPNLAKELTGELRNIGIGEVISALDDTGVLDALDELPEVTFGQLRRSVIPEDDVAILTQAGVVEAESEIATAIHYARLRLGRADVHPSEIAHKVVPELERAVNRLTPRRVRLRPPFLERNPRRSGMG
jgi:hypothetical protein